VLFVRLRAGIHAAGTGAGQTRKLTCRLRLDKQEYSHPKRYITTTDARKFGFLILITTSRCPSLKRVVDAIDENKETRSPQVARLQLASVSLVCYVKEISVEILSDQIDAEEEMRRQERAELLTAQATESRVLDILDTAMKKLIRDIMVTTSELKQAAGETARGLEAREMFRAAAVDGAIQQARDGITECRTSRQMQQTQELLGLASAG
jgi:hypothetical protein